MNVLLQAKTELNNGNIKRGKFNLFLATTLDITAMIVAVSLIIVTLVVNKYVKTWTINYTCNIL